MMRKMLICYCWVVTVSQPTEPGLADARVWRNPEMTEVGLALSRYGKGAMV